MNTQYSKEAEYWDRKNSIGMGDIRQRPHLLDIIGDVKGKKILDAGCGTGYFTRKISKLNAEVYGCDVESAMLKVANEVENSQPLGIKYDLCDIRKMSYDDDFFNIITTVGVLFHLDINGWKNFLKESQRVLKVNGNLFISIEHPFLFTKSSPTRSGKPCWAIHEQKSEADYTTSQEFTEKYFKSDGKMYETTLWHHSLENIINTVINSGFAIENIYEILVQKEDLISEFWGKEYGYPAFIQIKAAKK